MRLRTPTAFLFLFAPIIVSAQKLPSPAAPLKIDPMAAVPKLAPIVARSESDLAPVVERYSADLQSVTRRYDATDSPDQRRRMRDFYTAWRNRLHELRLRQAGRRRARRLRAARQPSAPSRSRCSIARKEMRGETANLLPFADRLLALQDTRRNLITIDPTAAARPSRPSCSRWTACARCSNLRQRPGGDSSATGACCRAEVSRHRGQPRRGQSRPGAEHREQLVSLLRRLRPACSRGG